MDSIKQFFVVGGPVVVVLAVFSVVALAVTLLKLWQAWQLRGAGDGPVNDALAHAEHGDRTQALLLVGDRRNPRADLVARTLHLQDKRHLTSEEIRAEVGRAARQHINQQASFLRVLDVIAVLAPLLGLLGTVLGMIAAFQAMQDAGTQVNPAVLSGGIWEALLTTAVGLGVAIPASLANAWLERRVENAASQYSDDIGRLFAAHADQCAADHRKHASRHQG